MGDGGTSGGRKMMKLLFVLFAPLLAFAQTDLPGPVGALPDSSGNPTVICSWNDAAQTHCSGIISGATDAFTWTLQILDSGYTFDNTIVSHSIVPSSNLTYSLGSCASSSTCPGGAGAFEYQAAHIETIYNYSSSPGGMYADTVPITLDTHAAQPIYFYTANALRAQIDGSGNFAVANLAGSGNRCMHAGSTGVEGIGSTADCLDPTTNITFSGLDEFTQSVTVHGNVTCDSTAYCSLGDTTHIYVGLHVHDIYDYSTSGALGIVANTLPIILDAVANQPIEFYTNNTLRGEFTGAGVFQVPGLGGGGTRCIHVDNSGNFSVFSADCGGSGVTSVTASLPLASSGGSNPNLTCSTCVTDVNNYLANTCSTVTLSTSSYQAICGSLSISVAGYYLITASVELVVYNPTVAAILYLNESGTTETALPFATLAQASAPSGLIEAVTVTQTWVRYKSSGATIGIDGIQSGTGTTTTNGGSLTAVFLHS